MPKLRIILAIVGIVIFVVFLIIIGITIITQPTFSVVAVSPTANSVGVSILSPIEVIFSRPLTKEEADRIAIVSSPAIEINKSLSAAKTSSMLFTPTVPLKTNQQYMIKINYGRTIYEWVFTTVSLENVSTEDQQNIQSEADKNFGDWAKAVDEKYPWLNKLPLQTDRYFFYFDIETEQFTGKLYPKTSSGVSIDGQTELMKKEIQEKLLALGIDVSKYKLTWEVSPEP